MPYFLNQRYTPALILSYSNNKVSYKLSPMIPHIIKHPSRAKSAEYSNKNAPSHNSSLYETYFTNKTS